MKLEKYLRLFFIALVALLVVMVVAPPALATDRGGDAEAIAGADVGDQVLNSGDAIGLSLSYGMGDVDINEGKNCMGSTQKANLIWGSQKLALNAWCASMFYELNGKHNFAAKLRCGIPEVIDKYPSVAACVEDQDLTPAVPEPTVMNEIEEFHEEDIEQVQATQAVLEERIAALEKKPAPRPRVIKQEAQAGYTDEQVEAVWAALKGDEDE